MKATENGECMEWEPEHEFNDDEYETIVIDKKQDWFKGVKG